MLYRYLIPIKILPSITHRYFFLTCEAGELAVDSAAGGPASLVSAGVVGLLAEKSGLLLLSAGGRETEEARVVVAVV
jgi:hypothetical protein